MKPGDLIEIREGTPLYPTRGGEPPFADAKEGMLALVISLDDRGEGHHYDLVLVQGRLAYVWSGALEIAR